MESNCFVCKGVSSKTIGTVNSDGYYVDCPKCGKYVISWEASMDVKFLNKNYIISGITRNNTEKGLSPINLTQEKIKFLIENFNYPKKITQKIDHLLLVLENKSDKPGDIIALDPDNDYPLLYCRDALEFFYFMDLIINNKYVQESSGSWKKDLIITEQGWNRIDAIEKITIQSNRVFVAMWFDKSTSSFYEGSIAKVITELNLIPIRIDLKEHNNKICDEIIAEINKCFFIIADFTGNRGGVYFEAGYAMGLGLPVIWTCNSKDIDNVHFDTRQYNHIVYETEEELYKRLKNRIEATILKRN